MNKNILFQHIQFFRLIPANILYLMSKNKEIIDLDLKRNLDEIPYMKVGIGALDYSLLFIKSYRNTFYFRVGDSVFLRHISRWLIRPLDTIEIHGTIGEGFRVFHNYCVIHPHNAGKNFTVHHGVTIGKGNPCKDNSSIVNPIIGDNVEIFSNAVVFGGINIGNNVQIGAGAVVNKNVPDNCTVIGNPMRIIAR